MAYAISKRGYERGHVDGYYGYAEVVLRGTMFGFAAGAASGALAGTLVFPILGTIYGAFYGVIVGGLLGLPCALVLGFVSWARPSVRTTRIISVVVALTWGTLAFLRFDVSGLGFLPYIAFSLGAVSAAVVGPKAVYRRSARSLLPLTEPRRA